MKKIKISNKTLLFICLFIGSWVNNAFAQDQWEEAAGDLNDARLLIEKESVLELPIKAKPLQKMQKIEREKQAAPQQYAISPLLLQLPGIDPDFDAAQIRKPSGNNLPLSSGYLKAGLGNFFTTYLEGHYYAGEEGIFEYGGNVKHLASSRGPRDGENSANSENSIGLFGKYFLTEGILKGNIGFERDVVHFYGYDTIPLEAQFDIDNIKQVYSIFDLGLSFMNDDPLADIHYETGFDFYTLGDNFNASEFNFDIFGKGKYEINDDSRIEAGVNLIFNTKNDSVKVNRNLILLNGAYHYQYDQLTIKAGLKLAYNGDTTFADSRVKIYPDIHAKYGLVEDKVAVYGRLSGGLEQVTLRSLSRENPFIGVNVPLAHTDRQIEFAGGIETAPNGKLGFKAEAGYSRVQNLYYFLNNEENQAKFDLFFEGNSEGIINLKVEASADIGPVKAILQTNFYDYGVDSLSDPFHRPSLVNTLSVAFNSNKKLFVNLDLYHLSGIKGREPLTGNTIDLDDIVDLNLKADYIINDNFSAFVALNNILTNNYQRYLYYDNMGINVLVGATYRLGNLGF